MTALPQPRPKAITPSVNSWNAAYLDAEYQRFKEDSGSVPEDLRSFFQGFDLASDVIASDHIQRTGVSRRIHAR